MQNGGQSPWQVPSARHVSEQQRAGGGYVPPPPPPQQMQNNALPGMQLPGPPPRPPISATQQHAMLLPPPPGNQANGYGMYNRQPQYSIPPISREPRAYNPMAYSEYEQLPPLPDNQPLTSATYIPGGDSFGPGVGIPALHTHPQQLHAPQPRPNLGSQQNSYYRGASNDFTSAPEPVQQTQQQQRYANDTYMSQNQAQNGTWYGNSQYSTYQQPQPQTQQAPTPPQQSSVPPPTPSTQRQKTLILPAKETQEHPSPASAETRLPFSQPQKQSTIDDSSSQGNREHSSSGETPASPSDQNWPLERVKIWLAAHGFSKEWQAAFQHLNVHGALFLDIGRSGDKRNIGFMPQTVLPQIARECTSNGVLWDQAKEREESRRIRRLVRDVVKSGGAGTPATATTNSTASLPLRARRESGQYMQTTSAGTDGGVENSPNLSRSDAFGSQTPSTAGGTGDDSPGRTMPPSTIAQRRRSGQRSITLDSLSSAVNDSGRSGLSSAVLGSIGDIPRKHSPSASSEFGASGQRFQSSPQQSPGLPSAKPGSNGQVVGNARYYGHFRNTSSETGVPNYGTNLSPGPRLSAGGTPNNREADSAFAKPPPEDSTRRRNATEGSRPPATDNTSKSVTVETPASAKEHKSGFLAKFRRDKKRDEAQQPSPDEDQSPASPQAVRNAPYGRPALASSETSLAERPPSRKSAHTGVECAESVPPMPRGRPVARDGDKKFIFVTPDGWNYRLIDISEVESAEQLRVVICYNLGVPEGPDVTIHLTSPGQVDHDEALSDQLLMSARLRMADPNAGLKLYVRAPGVLGAPSESAGLGLAFPASPFGRASFSEKPLDPATYARLTEAHVDSPSTMRSGESTLVPDKIKQIQTLPKEGETTPNDLNAKFQEDMLQQDFQNLSAQERAALLAAKSAEHQREMERRQRLYLENRRSQIAENQSGKKGYVHDFDKRTSTSPYGDGSRPVSSGSGDQDRKTDPLVPMRKPPPVPEPTSTLVKVNSLTKKQGPNARTSWPNRKEEPWKRISSGSIPEEDGKAPRGIGAALAGAGRTAGAVGMASGGASSNAPMTSSGLQKSMTAPDLSQPTARRALAGIDFNRATSDTVRASSPRSPFTMSKGGQSFKIPEYVEADDERTDEEDTLKASQRPNLSLRMPSHANVNKIKGDLRNGRHSPDLSPSSTHPPASQLQRMQSKRGPSFDLPERQVDFQRSPAMVPEEDEDSDDGLFAIPLANKTLPKSAATPASASLHKLGLGSDTPASSRSPNRPELRLKTSRANVKFESPKIAPLEQVQSNALDHEEEPRMPDIDRHIPTSASSNQWSADSPDELNRFGRRESFASDMWANRPPAEGIVEHLDDFFPNVDLDQPMGESEEGAGSSPVSTDKLTLSTKPSSTDLQSRSITPMSSADESDAVSTDDDALKRTSGFTSVAQRSMRKSGGLGRTKSIRDVVKNNYQMHSQLQHPSTSSYASSRAGSGVPALQNPLLNRVSTLRNDGGIVRRKSTKMFGAKIEQVKPSRGSRLITNLETIPQDTIPASNVQHVHKNTPERQATFKWMKGQLIGKGTFGRVYLGMNTTTGELLAVKQVEVSPKAQNADPAKIKEMVKALDIEIDTMKDLDHVNIVQYLGCEKKEYSISIFLEYISGGSVGSCYRKHGKFEEPVVSSFTGQTLKGLAYLHSEGILHRDLKADNILVDIDGTCKISDFGISKRSANPYNNDTTNSMQGSVFWMAPEVIRAQSQAMSVSHQNGLDATSAMSQGYSAKVDIWSLGCVVLEMFAGRRPWSKEEAIGAIFKLGSLNQAPPIPEDVASTVGIGALSFMYDCFTM